MIGEGAAVLHDVDPGVDERTRKGVVADPELEPDQARERLHRQEIAEVRGQELGEAEDVNHVDGLAQLGQRRPHRLAPQRRPDERRVDGDDAVALRVEVVGNIESRPARLVVRAEHGDGPGARKDVADLRQALDLGHARAYRGPRGAGNGIQASLGTGARREACTGMREEAKEQLTRG
jgi:hypothetical protein